MNYHHSKPTLLRKLCFGFILVSRISLASCIAVILGETATLDCYDPISANQDGDSFFVELDFISPLRAKRVVSFRPSLTNYKWYDSAYRTRLTFLNSGQAKIEFIGLNDEGEYVCTPQSFETVPNASKQTTITVYVSPHVKVEMVNQPIVAGTKEVGAVQCIANAGKPPAIVRWKADQFSDFKQLKTNTSTGSLTTVITTLMVTPTKSLNKQEVLCEVNHPAFRTKNITVVALNVTYAPEFPRILVDKDKQHLTCVADGNPEPNYEWTLPPGSSPPKKFGQTVKIFEPYGPSRQNDTYICTAGNSAGQAKPVNISVYEAMHFSPSQANASLIVGVSIGVVAVIALMTAVYCCMFRRSRRKDELIYSKQTHFVQHSVDRYSSTRPFIQHENDSLHKNRPPSPVRPPPNDFYDDDDGQYSDSGSGYGGDVDLEAPVLPSENESSRNGPKSGITSTASMNFRKQRQRPTSLQGSSRSKGTTSLQPYSDDSSLSSDGYLSQKYDLPPADYEDYPSEPPSKYDRFADDDSRYMDIEDRSSLRKGSEKRKSPINEPPVVYAQVNKQRSRKKP